MSLLVITTTTNNWYFLAAYFITQLLLIDINAIVINTPVLRAQKPIKSNQHNVGNHNSISGQIINLFDSGDTFYYMMVDIGTPPQSFEISFEMNTNFTWVLDKSYAPLPCAKSPGSIPCSGFNSSASSTYVSQPQLPSWNLSFPGAIGIWGTDTICLNGVKSLCAPKQLFGQAISGSNAVIQQYQYYGNIGLQPSFSGDTTTSFLSQIMPAFDLPLFTVNLKSAGPFAINADGGSITFGAIDTINCDSNIIYAPITSTNGYNYWGVTVNGISVGDVSFTNASLAIVDPYQPFIVGPDDWLLAFAKSLNATLDSSLLAGYLVPCNGTFPDLILNIPTTGNASNTFQIPPSIYVENANLADPNQCVLQIANFSATATPFDGYGYILGDTFFRVYCGIFDIGNQRVGFAKRLG